MLDQETPRYRLIAPFYCDDVLFGEGQEIQFDGPANESMEPLNQAARERIAQYWENQKAGLAPGKTLPGSRHEALDGAYEDAYAANRGVRVIGAQTPLMGNSPEAVQRQRGRPKKVQVVPPPEGAPKRQPVPAVGTVLSGLAVLGSHTGVVGNAE